MAGGLSSIYYSLTARELMMMGLDVIEVRSIIYSSQNLHNIYVLNLYHEDVIQRPIRQHYLCSVVKLGGQLE